MFDPSSNILIILKFTVVIFFFTCGKGVKHFGQGIRELWVTLVHLEVYFTEVRCSIHANFHKAYWIIIAILLFTFFWSFIALLGSKHVLTEWPHWWPPYHLCPIRTVQLVKCLSIYEYFKLLKIKEKILKFLKDQFMIVFLWYSL